MTLPNMLTLSRIFMIPLMVIFFYWLGETGRILAALVFAIAAITDWFDGYLARKLNQMSALGAFLDPVADKLIVCVALVLLAGHYAETWLTIPAMIIVGREIVISALREWMAELGRRATVAVSHIGKIKTTLQMISIGVLLGAPSGSLLEDIGVVALYAAAILTLWSMVVYLKAAWPALRE
ncbi:MAG: CDP-diacylglycerol--glycerol-3-phosphate 3-phosphatidyltransferase [Oleibacter sp.]|nr:CDP-diacylglycerol--glycerol-3-phosphate 3-phosphatidyltransferase [Thalassolituus sp.]